MFCPHRVRDAGINQLPGRVTELLARNGSAWSLCTQSSGGMGDGAVAEFTGVEVSHRGVPVTR